MFSETDRVRFRQLTVKDAGFIYQLYNTDEFLRFVGDKHLRSVRDAKYYLLDSLLPMYQLAGLGLYLVELKESNAPIGICGLVKRESLEDIDIGYGFLPEYCHQGYGFESAQATIEYARASLGLAKLVAITLSDNRPCICLLEKLGLSFERNVEEAVSGPSLALYSVSFKPVF